jgi:AmmeMemoRadiSam system protein B/AmmeMemoRadiSam system protein A
MQILRKDHCRRLGVDDSKFEMQNSKLRACQSRISNLESRIILTALLLVFYAAAAACGNQGASAERPPAVAGQFYPSDPGKLKLAIEQFLQGSTAIPMEKPVAIIVPHAGYIYSGQIAADAYRQVMGRQYDTVVVLGVNHKAPGFSGISTGGYTAFRTPLGSVPVDEEIVSALLKECKDCGKSREVHVNEHSIEVQIPFIQVLFPKAKIVPAIIHPPDYQMCVRFGQVLAKILKGRQALIVISSDLSHYPEYENAAKADRVTLETIASLDTARISSMMRELNLPKLETRACGEAAIIAGLTAAKALGAKRAVIAGYANSGDASVGDRSQTVGYGGVVLAPGDGPSDTNVLTRPAPPSSATPLQSSDKKALLAFARETILRYLTTDTIPLARNFSARIDFPQGAFVTLRKKGALRGCIGRIPPSVALGKTVGEMALQAAFNDPRFPPVQISEVKGLEIEISVLTPPKAIAAPEEIVVGRDGVWMFKAGASAVFLPQVARENNWNRTEMLDNLCRKAGLASGCWKSEAKFQVFQADVFSESQFK